MTAHNADEIQAASRQWQSPSMFVAMSQSHHTQPICNDPPIHDSVYYSYSWLNPGQFHPVSRL